MRPNLTLYLALASCVAFTACATATDANPKERGIAAFKDDARLGEPVEKICFNRSIDGFSNAMRDTVVLSAGVSKNYIVEVSGICPNLDHAQSIAIDSTLSCVSRGDYLIVSDSAFSLQDNTGFGPDRCLIDSIYTWDKRAKNTDEETASPEN